MAVFFGGDPARGVKNLAGADKDACLKMEEGRARTEGTMKASETSRVENDGRGQKREGGAKVEEKPKRNQGKD